MFWNKISSLFRKKQVHDLSKIKVIVYDLDDTLYSVRDFAFSGFDAVSNWLERNHFIGGFNPLIKTFYDEGKRDNLFNQTLDHMGLSFNTEMINNMVSVYREHRPNISLLSESIDIIKYFSKEKKQSLITDGYEIGQRNKIKSLNLDNLLDYTLCTDSLGRENWKPSLVPFKKTMEYFNLPGEAFVYIGDNPTKDFLAPNKLGWVTVRIKREGQECFHDQAKHFEYEAKYTIKDLGELKELIR